MKNAEDLKWLVILHSFNLERPSVVTIGLSKLKECRITNHFKPSAFFHLLLLPGKESHH